MPVEMVQLNTRVPADLKRGGDAVFSRFGLTTSEVVRGVWRFAVEAQSVPDFLLGDQAVIEKPSVPEGAGLAVAVAERECGFVDKDIDRPMETWRDERDSMYDEMLDQMDERCR